GWTPSRAIRFYKARPYSELPPTRAGHLAMKVRTEPRGMERALPQSGRKTMNLLVLIILLALVIGALPSWPYSAGWGYYPSGAFGLLLLILLVLALTRAAP